MTHVAAIGKTIFCIVSSTRELISRRLTRRPRLSLQSAHEGILYANSRTGRSTTPHRGGARGTPPLCTYTGMLLLVIVLCALHSHEAARDLMTRARFRRGRERERVFLAKRIVLPLRHAIALMYHTVMLLVASLGSNIILHKNWFLPSGDVGYATHGAIAISSPLSNL